MAMTHHMGISVTPEPATDLGLEVNGKSLLTEILFESAANKLAGIKTIGIGFAGSGVVAYNKVRTSSRLFLTLATTFGSGKKLTTCSASIASGSHFKIRLCAFSGNTVATASGRVSYLVINKY